MISSQEVRKCDCKSQSGNPKRIFLDISQAKSFMGRQHWTNQKIYKCPKIEAYHLTTRRKKMAEFDKKWFEDLFQDLKKLSETAKSSKEREVISKAASVLFYARPLLVAEFNKGKVDD